MILLIIKWHPHLLWDWSKIIIFYKEAKERLLRNKLIHEGFHSNFISVNKITLESLVIFVLFSYHFLSLRIILPLKLS